jgi:hypothetical protein
LALANTRQGLIPSRQLLRLVRSLSLSNSLHLVSGQQFSRHVTNSRHQLSIHLFINRMGRKYQIGCGVWGSLWGSLSCFSLLALFLGALQLYSRKQVY